MKYVTEKSTSVVSKMGIVGHFSDFKNFIKSNNKIPHYAREYKKEYLYIRGLNKEIKYFLNKLDDLNNRIFESYISNRLKYIMKRFLRYQEKSKINNDISNLIFQIYDINNFIEVNRYFDLCKYRYDYFLDYSYDSDDSDNAAGEYLVDGKPYPGFEEIYDIFKMIFNQIKYEGSDDYDDEFSDVVFPDTEYDYDVIDEF